MAKAYITFSSPIESALAKHPDHVHAIGMISIEMAHLEISIAHLFGTVINVGAHTARLIYFTPKAAIPRLQVVSNIINQLPDSAKGLKDESLPLIDQAKALMGKRHDYIHNAWGFSKEHKAVVRTALPDTQRFSGKPVKLKELTDHVIKIRQLNMEITNARPRVEWTLRPDASPGILIELGSPQTATKQPPPKAHPAKR